MLIHGDAAFAGQGVVAETLNLSQLSGYHVGGTIHLVINNQLGFTTAPGSARSSFYPTDVAKMIQAPIFHVNGDDPEACARAARLAFDYRETFQRDVVLDIVCYRRYGHNEGDDPSYTQPQMYKIIDQMRSVRKIYTETLVRRGDITMEDAEAALSEFNARLQSVLEEVRTVPVPELLERAGRRGARGRCPPPRPVSNGPLLERVARASVSVPDGFSLHPKLARQFAQRLALLRDRARSTGPSAEALAVRVTRAGGIERASHRPRHPPGHVLASSRRVHRLRQRRRVRAAREHGRAGLLHRARLVPQRVRGARL